MCDVYISELFSVVEVSVTSDTTVTQLLTGLAYFVIGVSIVNVSFKVDMKIGMATYCL